MKLRKLLLYIVGLFAIAWISLGLLSIRIHAQAGQPAFSFVSVSNAWRLVINYPVDVMTAIRFNNMRFVEFFGNTPGVYNESNFINAVNDVCPAPSSGSPESGHLIITPHVYTFASTVTVNNFCHIDFEGTHVAAVGGVEIVAANNTVKLFQISADTVQFRNIWFQSPGVLSTSSSEAIDLGVSGGQTTFDTYLQTLWFNGFNIAINCVNCGGPHLDDDTFENNNVGLNINATVSNQGNDISIVGGRWYANGPNGGGAAIRCNGNSLGASTNAGYLNISGGIFDFNGSGGSGTINTSGAIQILNDCNNVNITGVGFNNDQADDIYISGSRNVIVSGNFSNKTGRAFVTGSDAQALNVTANTIGSTDINNISPHGVVIFVRVSGTSANNVVANNTSSFYGSTTATSFLVTDAATTGTRAINNSYVAIANPYGGVADTTAAVESYGLFKPTTLAVGGGATVFNSSSVVQQQGTITTTAAASDALTVTGLTSSGHCYFAATNATGAGLTGVYIVATANTATLNHSASAGGTFNISCSFN